MSIRVLSFDYDGSLFHSDFIKSENVIINNKEFLDGIKRDNTDIDRIILLSGSNRQSFLIEFFNMKGIPELSSFSAAKEIEHYLAPATLDTFLLADIYGDLEDGASYARAMDKEYKGEHSDWLFDDTKVTVLYAQMHKIAMENPYEDIVFDFYDDRQDILNELAHFFAKYVELVPGNITLRLNKYAGKEVTPIKNIEGQGFVDTNFKQTVKDMTSLTIEKHPECDGINKPLRTSKVVTPELLLNRVALIPEASELESLLDKLKDFSTADLKSSQEIPDDAEEPAIIKVEKPESDKPAEITTEDKAADLKKSQEIAADTKSATAEPEDKNPKSDKPAEIKAEDKDADLKKSQEIPADTKEPATKEIEVTKPESDKAAATIVEDKIVDLQKSQEIIVESKQPGKAESNIELPKSDKPAEIIVEDQAIDLDKSQEIKAGIENELKAENPEEYNKGDSDKPELPADKENNVDETQNHFHEELKVFKTKTENWLLEMEEPSNTPEKRALYDAASKAAREMHEKIENGAKEFFIDPNDQDRKNAFRQVCTDAIAAARPELEKHRVLNKALANVALAIVTLGIGFIFAGLINLAVSKGKHFLFFTTNSEKRLDALELDVERMTAPAPAA